MISSSHRMNQRDEKSSMNASKASKFAKKKKKKSKKKKDLQLLNNDSEDNNAVAADREAQVLLELFELDQKYMLNDNEEDEEDAFARETRKQKVNKNDVPLGLMTSPFIERRDNH